MLPITHSMQFTAVHSIPGIENENRYTWKCFPFNVIQCSSCSSIPGIEMLPMSSSIYLEMPGNASPVIQCSSLNSRYRK